MRALQGSEPGHGSATEFRIVNTTGTATEASATVHQHPYIDTDDHRYASNVQVHQEHTLRIVRIKVIAEKRETSIT